MGLAIETVGFTATTGAVGNVYATAAADAGDQLSVRQFASGSKARIEFVGLQPAAAGATRIEIKSPSLHDNVQGMEFVTAESPAAFLLPRRTGESVVRGDTLTVQLATSIAAATVIGGAMSIYYENADGLGASLKMWSDISASVTHMKPFSVTPGAVAANTWQDTSLTTAGAQLDADRYYAVLGYVCSDPYIAVGIKGQMTSNLRLCGPGSTSTLDISSYFAEMADREQTPHIPVFYANNRGATYLSVLSAVAVAAPKDVTLICAQLAPTFAP
jgi:hypothetical protein